jgi:hypothetical protein
MNKELNVEEISCVKDLLKTGLLEGASITYISEKKQVLLVLYIYAVLCLVLLGVPG